MTKSLVALRQGLVSLCSMEWAGLTILLLAATLSIFETTAIVLVFGDSLQGANLIGDKAPLRNFLELLNFAATSALAIIAVAALVLAKRQTGEAENARLTSIYMSIVERWNSNELVTARTLLFAIVDAFRVQNAADGTSRVPGEALRVCDTLLWLKATDRTALRKHVILLTFFEDLGLLCRNNYVRKRDIFDLLGSSITFQLELFGPYIHASRKAGGEESKALYANAIYVYKAARAYAGEKSIEEAVHPRDVAALDLVAFAVEQEGSGVGHSSSNGCITSGNPVYRVARRGRKQASRPPARKIQAPPC